MSAPELMLLSQIRDAGLPEPVCEFKFALPRKWRADFAYPDHKLLVEVEGGTWIRGRHSRGKGFEGDCCKYNAATELGYRLLRFTPGMIEAGIAVEAIKRILED